MLSIKVPTRGMTNIPLCDIVYKKFSKAECQLAVVVSHVCSVHQLLNRSGRRAKSAQEFSSFRRALGIDGNLKVQETDVATLALEQSSIRRY